MRAVNIQLRVCQWKISSWFHQTNWNFIVPWSQNIFWQWVEWVVLTNKYSLIIWSSNVKINDCISASTDDVKDKYLSLFRFPLGVWVLWGIIFYIRVLLLTSSPVSRFGITEKINSLSLVGWMKFLLNLNQNTKTFWKLNLRYRPPNVRHLCLWDNRLIIVHNLFWT